MKNLVLILAILVVLIVGGWFGFNKFSEFSHARTAKKEPFLWGVTMRPGALGNYDAKVWNGQLKLAKELGVGYVRITWQHDAYWKKKADAVAFHDNVIKAITENGLSTYLVIEANPDVLELDDPYYEGYNNAYQIASHYKGKIKYYQLLNEAGSVALNNGNPSGDKIEDYDPQKYEKVREWIKGASAGINKADPDAYRVITNQWIHYGFLELITKDKVDYDIIGWDWFSDMGLMSENKLDDGVNILEKLKKYNKPIILAEVNQRPEEKDGDFAQDEPKQAKFIEDMATWAYNSGVIKGLIVLELVDVVNTGKDFIDRYGLVAAERTGSVDSGKGKITEPRKAYNTLQELIKTYPR